MNDELHKQVIEPTPAADLRSLKRTIDLLQVVYLVLFITSLALIVVNTQSATGSGMTYLWALALGAAVVTRLVRQSMVNKYNARLAGGRPGPIV